MKKIIKSQNKLLTLHSFLTKNVNENKIILSNDELSITLESCNDEELEQVMSLLSIYILVNESSNFVQTIKSKISDKKYEKSIFKEMFEHNEKYLLYVNPVKILMYEYFKDNDILNIESFKTFNCRGLRKEIFEINNDTLNLYNDIIENISLSKNDNKIDNDLCLEELNNSLLKLCKEIEYKSESDFFDEFDIIHVKVFNENIEIFNANLELVTDKILSCIQDKIPQSINNDDEIQNLTILLLTCISILKTKKIIIHNVIPKEKVSKILLYLYKSQDYNKKVQKVDIYQCAGCKSC